MTVRCLHACQTVISLNSEFPNQVVTWDDRLLREMTGCLIVTCTFCDILSTSLVT